MLKNFKLVLLSIFLLLLFPAVVSAETPVRITGREHIEDIGWKDTVDIDHTVFGTTHEHKKLEAIEFASEQPDEYRLRVIAHVENIGWQSETSDSEVAGTTGLNDGIEALVINQEGREASKYEMRYRAHVENYGWTDWAQNGEPVGTTGLACQIEALEIKIYPAGETTLDSSGDVDWAFKTKDSINVNYKDAFDLTNIYPHNTEVFTEGLFFENGKLYETGGRLRHSALYKNIDLNSYKAESVQKLPDEYFAEGCVILNSKLYVLTYQENAVLVYDPESLEHITTLQYNDREGWGLTTDGRYLIASDGSSHIYFMDENCKDVRKITVTDNGVPIDQINELEYVNGYILANIWYSDKVIVIDPNSGNIVYNIDFSGIYNGSGDCMNGIAYNPETNRYYFTGKYWSKTFELKSNLF